MMNLKHIFTFSLLFVAVVGNAQLDREYKKLPGQDEWSISTDLIGLVAFPIYAGLSENDKNYYRIQLRGQYLLDEKFEFSVILGKEQRKSNVVGINFLDYEYDSKYVQIRAYYCHISRKKFSYMYGLGLSFGKIEERGITTIGDTYFDPYKEELLYDEWYRGWLLSTKYEYIFTPRFSFVLDFSLSSNLLFEKNETQVVYTNPGFGTSWIYSRGSAFSMNGTILLKYSLL